MARKISLEDDRIRRSVSISEILGLPGVMPSTYANQRGENCREHDDEGFDLSGFRD